MSLQLTSRRPRCVITAGLLFLTLAAAPPGTARAQEDAGYRLYRCAVLGDRSACEARKPLPETHIEVRMLPGAYATYLIHQGQDSAQAIQAARKIGEKPTLRTTRITRRELSSFERYERFNGRLDRPDAIREVLAEVPVEDLAARQAQR